MNLLGCKSQGLSAGSPHDDFFQLPTSYGLLGHSAFLALCILLNLQELSSCEPFLLVYA